MNKRKLQKLERLAKRKGFYLTIMEEQEEREKHGLFWLECINDERDRTDPHDDGIECFHTEDALVRFLENIPDYKTS